MIPIAYLPPIPRPPNDPTSWLLNARVGWKGATLVGVESRPGDGALALKPVAGSGRTLTEPSGSFGGLRLPANVALGPGGKIYLLDRATLRLKRFNPCACGFDVLPCFGGEGSGTRELHDAHGIAVCGGSLFVCDTGNHRLLKVDLRRLASQGIWRPPATAGLNQPWEPYGVAFNGLGHAFVTDPANGMVHRFSVSGRWEKSFGGFRAVRFIAIDCRDLIYLVIHGETGVRTIDADGNDVTAAGGSLWRPDMLARSFPRPQVPVDAAGNLHLQAFLPPECLPQVQTTSTGRARPAPEPGVFDLNGDPVAPANVPAPVVVAYPLPTPPSTPSGAYYSSPLDSQLYRCQWHRVVLKGKVPATSLVVVATYTAEALLADDQIAALPEEAWQTKQVVGQLDGEWDCLIRSSGGRYLWLRLGFYSKGTNTPAIHRIVVEYPRISLSRYLPAVFIAEPVSADFTDRFLSLFDTVFRSIEHTIDTQARFFDPMSTPAVRDPKTGVDFLSWLASWIGVCLNRQWPEAKRRQFLKRAGRLFNIRGTPEGLRRVLLFYLGMESTDDRCTDALPNACCPPKPLNCAPAQSRRRWEPPPLILEHYRLRRWLMLGAGRLGDQAVLWGNRIANRSQLDGTERLGATQLLSQPGPPFLDPFRVYANQFTVFVPARFGRTDQDRKMLDTLLRTESPAHTLYQVNYVKPLFRIGVQSTIGLDAVVARVPEGVTLGQTRLNGVRALTGEPGKPDAPSFEVGREGRIGHTILT
jgi:phage tail-like protein